jgi:hypothetical protein
MIKNLQKNLIFYLLSLKSRLGISFLRIKKYQKLSKNIKKYQQQYFHKNRIFFQNFGNLQKLILQKF